VLIVLSSAGLCGQWITGYYSGPWTGQPVSSIPWSKYTHVLLLQAGARNTNDGRVCIGYIQQADINAELASKPLGKKLIVSFGEGPVGYNDQAGCISGDSNTWTADTAPAVIATFVQNIANFVNQ